jgi:hypothetical protein
MYELTDEFDNEELNHFTHYDYLLQLIENGQFSAFKEHIKELSNEAVVKCLEVFYQGYSSGYKNMIRDEILRRMT